MSQTRCTLLCKSLPLFLKVLENSLMTAQVKGKVQPITGHEGP